MDEKLDWLSSTGFANEFEWYKARINTTIRRLRKETENCKKLKKVL